MPHSALRTKGKGKGRGNHNYNGKQTQNGTHQAKGNSVPAPDPKQIESQVKNVLAKMGVLPGNAQRSYAEVAGAKPSAQEQAKDATMTAIEDPEAATASTVDPKWPDMTVVQLKQEHSSLTTLASQLEKAGLEEASLQAKTKASQLHDYLVSKRSSGQQLDTYTAAVRKATTAVERHTQHIQDLKTKLLEAEKKLTQLEQTEAAAKQALTDFQRKNLAPEEAGTILEENTLTETSAKFVSAILPRDIPVQAQEALQIQLNQALAAIQMQITQAVTAEKAAQAARAQETLATNPATPVHPANAVTPPLPPVHPGASAAGVAQPATPSLLGPGGTGAATGSSGPLGWSVSTKEAHAAASCPMTSLQQSYSLCLSLVGRGRSRNCGFSPPGFASDTQPGGGGVRNCGLCLPTVSVADTLLFVMALAMTVRYFKLRNDDATNRNLGGWNGVFSQCCSLFSCTSCTASSMCSIIIISIIIFIITIAYGGIIAPQGVIITIIAAIFVIIIIIIWCDDGLKGLSPTTGPCPGRLHRSRRDGPSGSISQAATAAWRDAVRLLSSTTYLTT